MSPLFPIFLDLTLCHCLIIGFGEVGQRKFKDILPSCPKSVLVVDPVLQPADISRYCDFQNVSVEARGYQLSDFEGKSLVFAATQNFAENRKIVEICNQVGIFCNSVTDNANGTFVVPSIVRSSHMALALSTLGASPVLTRHWKGELAEWLEGKEPMLRFVTRVRQALKKYTSDANGRTAILRRMAQSPIESWLKEKKSDMVCQWLKGECPDLPEELLEELSNDLS